MRLLKKSKGSTIEAQIIVIENKNKNSIIGLQI
jgi:hypothetical protein